MSTIPLTWAVVQFWENYMESLEQKGEMMRLELGLFLLHGYNSNDIWYLWEKVEKLPIAKRPKHISWGSYVVGDQSLAISRSYHVNEREHRSLSRMILNFCNLCRVSRLDIYSGKWLAVEIVDRLPKMRTLKTLGLYQSPEARFEFLLHRVCRSERCNTRLESLFVDGHYLEASDMAKLQEKFPFLGHFGIEGTPSVFFYDQIKNLAYGQKSVSFFQNDARDMRPYEADPYALSVSNVCLYPTLREASFGVPEMYLPLFLASISKKMEGKKRGGWLSGPRLQRISFSDKVVITNDSGRIGLEIRGFRNKKYLDATLEVVATLSTVEMLDLSDNVPMPTFAKRISAILKSNTNSIRNLCLCGQRVDSDDFAKLRHGLDEAKLTAFSVGYGKIAFAPIFFRPSQDLSHLSLSFTNEDTPVFYALKCLLPLHPHLRNLRISVQGFSLDNEEWQKEDFPAFTRVLKNLRWLETITLAVDEPGADGLSVCQQNLLNAAKRHRTVRSIAFSNAANGGFSITLRPKDTKKCQILPL